MIANRFGRKLLVVLVATLLAGAILVRTASAENKKTYQNLVVQAFDTSSSGDLPADFADSLRRDIIKHLEQTKRFRKITFLEKGQQAPADADIILTGKIENFKEGSRAARYLVPGVGATKIKAAITFTDPASNKSLLDAEVHGSVYFGVFGGSSMGAVNGLSKGLAGDVKKQLP
jgi:hypothetical protein